jgi:hypothetical protein
VQQQSPQIHAAQVAAGEEPAPAEADPGRSGAGLSNGIYSITLVLAAVMFGVGLYLAVQKQGWAMLAAGSVSVIAVLVTWPLAHAIANSRVAELRRRDALATLVTDRLQQFSVMLDLMSEQQLLSDRAKQVAFREKDRDALRRAIKEDLARKDWEAALALVQDMETVFGYKQEAEQYREEIHKFREEVVRRQVQDSIGQIDMFCRQEKWSDALRQAERLIRFYPENEQIRRMPQEIEVRRQGTKRQLLDAWNEAIARKDVDGSIEILKKLDLYLTPQEGESMREAARNVFKEKLNQLGTQFTLAVQDKKYADAIRVGEIIMRDFPNSGIAREVRDMMDNLRGRVQEPEMARV